MAWSGLVQALGRHLNSARTGLAEEELYRRTTRRELHDVPSKPAFELTLSDTAAVSGAVSEDGVTSFGPAGGAPQGQPEAGVWSTAVGLLDMPAPSHWRMRLGRSLESHIAHLVIIFLVVLDLIALFGEMMLRHVCHSGTPAGTDTGTASGPGGATGTGSRLTTASGQWGSAVTPTGLAPAYGALEGSDLAAQWEHGLHWASIGIVCLLLLYQGLLLLAFGRAFFRKIWYVFDVIVLAISLVLELTLTGDEGGFVTVLLVWRVVRIVHGLVITEGEAASDSLAVRKALALAEARCTCGGVHGAIQQVDGEEDGRFGHHGLGPTTAAPGEEAGQYSRGQAAAALVPQLQIMEQPKAQMTAASTALLPVDGPTDSTPVDTGVGVGATDVDSMLAPDAQLPARRRHRGRVRRAIHHLKAYMDSRVAGHHGAGAGPVPRPELHVVPGPAPGPG